MHTIILTVNLKARDRFGDLEGWTEPSGSIERATNSFSRRILNE
jgi:hypothetical protein